MAKKCKYCGFIKNPNNSKFCGKCGSRLKDKFPLKKMINEYWYLILSCSIIYLGVRVLCSNHDIKGLVIGCILVVPSLFATILGLGCVISDIREWSKS